MIGKAVLVYALLPLLLAPAAIGAQSREFFAFDNGLTRIASLDDKTATLKQLGYDGIGWRSGRVKEMLAALEKHGLRMSSIYVRATVDKDRPSYDPRLPEEIRELKGKGTTIWLFLLKGKEPSDETAVRLVREVGSLAAEAGLKVALYPHVGFYVATTRDALRVAKKVALKNVGVSFNLCHFLMQNDVKELEALVREAAPHLFLVSLNGADEGRKLPLPRALQRLDKGTFDNRRLLAILDKVGYDGPIGLQCYSIPGDDRQNLEAAMDTWRLLRGLRDGDVGRLFKGAAACDFGMSRRALVKVESYLQKGTAADRRQIESRLAALLDDPAATHRSKLFAGQMLSRFGTEQSLTALAKALHDEKLSHLASFALGTMPCPAAHEVLLRAIGETEGRFRLSVISSIGARGNRESVTTLAKLVSSRDTELARAAISALGRIGGAKAAEALREAKVAAGLEACRMDSYLACLEGLLAESQASEAAKRYRELLERSGPALVRVAALRGVALAEKEKALPTVLAMLADKDPELRRAASPILAEMPGAAATKALAKALPSLAPEVQLAVLGVLAGRGAAVGPEVSVAVTALAASKSAAVRVEALRTLGAVGGLSSVALLTKAATEGGEAGRAACESLNRLSCDGADAAIVKAMQQADSKTRLLLIRALTARASTEAVPALFTQAADRDPAVRRASVKALGALAGKGDLKKLVTLVVSAGDTADLRESTEALARTARRAEASDTAIAAVVERLAGAPPEAAASLLRVLRRIGGDEALAAVRGQLAREQTEIRKAAIQALGDWPTPTAIGELLARAKSESSDLLHVLALRGFVKQIGLPGSRPVDDTAKLLSEALAAARRPDEKKALLAVLPRFHCDRTIKLAEACRADPALKAEAELALRKMKMMSCRRFDFQTARSPVMAGFTEVTQSVVYNPKRGFGWDRSLYGARDRKKGSPLTRDLVLDAAPRTFRVNLDNGQYWVTVYVGDQTHGHDEVEIRAEGQLQHKGITSRAGEVKEVDFQVTVNDGVLDVEIRDGGGNNPHWTCAGLVIGR